MQKAVTWRSLLVGTLLTPLNAWWVIQMELVRYSAHPTTISILFNVIFIVLVLSVINTLVARKRPSWAMNQGELLVIYMMMALSSVMASHDLMQILIQVLTYPFYMPSSHPDWARWLPFLPKQVMMSDPVAVANFYQGNTAFPTVQLWKLWAPVILFWTLFLGLILWVMQCLNALLRRQWMDNEKLSFPVVMLPMALTDDAGSGQFPAMFRKPAFWLAFGAAAIMDITNSLNLYYPSIPGLLTPGFGLSYVDILPYFPNKPWNAIGWTPISWYPFMIGFGMLLPLDFLFSCWFFYIYWKLLQVGVVAYGYDKDPRFPYANYQGMGAYLSFFLYSIWLSRHYLKQVGKAIIGRKNDLDESREPLKYRWALLGALLGAAGLMLLCLYMGMSWWVPPVFFGIYFLLAVAITRMRAEMGTPIHDIHFTGPDYIMTDLAGSSGYKGSDLAAMSIMYSFNRAYRAHPMPHQMEAMKMAQRTNSKQSAWFWAMIYAGVLAIFCAFIAILQLGYHYGMNAKVFAKFFGFEAWNRMNGWVQAPTPANPKAGIALGVGLLIAVILQSMRMAFPWWPFHPLGFAISGNWEINLVWMPLFIAWMVKSVVFRYGGLQGFQRLLPLCYGLMLGQFTVGSIVNIIGIIHEIPTYMFWQ